MMLKNSENFNTSPMLKSTFPSIISISNLRNRSGQKHFSRKIYSAYPDNYGRRTKLS